MEMNEEIKPADEDEKLPFPKIPKLIIGAEFILSYVTTTIFYFLERIAYIYLNRINRDVNRELSYTRGFASVFSFFPSWLADCYFEKYWVFTITYVITCFWPIFIFLLVHSGVSTLIKNCSFEIAKYYTVIYYSVEGVRFTILSEQMELPQQEHNIPLYFSLLYLARNVASAIATSLLAAHGHDETFVLGNSAIVIFLFIGYNFFFVLIRKKLKGEEPVPCMYSRGIACLLSAVYNWIRSWGKKKDGVKRSLMDYAGARHDIFFVYGWKAFSKVSIFCSLSIFVGVTEIKYRNFTVSQLERLVPLDFIPPAYYLLDIAHFCSIIWLIIWNLDVLPIFHRFKIASTTLQMFMLGFVLTGAALVASLAVEIGIEKLSTKLPGPGYGQMRVFNAEDSVVEMKLNHVANESLDWFYIPPRGLWTVGYMIVKKMKEVAVTVKHIGDKLTIRTDTIHVSEMESQSYIILESQIIHVEGFDPVAAGPPGMNDPLNPRVYVLCGLSFCFGRLQFKNKLQTKDVKLPDANNRTTLFTLPTGVYNVSLYYSGLCSFVLSDVRIEVGGVYAVLIYLKSHRNRGSSFFTIVKPNQLSMAIVIPQIFLYSFGYLLCRIYGFAFMYTQSPPKLRCTFWIFSLYAYAGASAIVYLDRAYWHPRTSVYQIVEFLLLHFVTVSIFLYFAIRYKYQTWCSEGAVFRGYPPMVTRHLAHERKQMSIFNKLKLRRHTVKPERALSLDSRHSESESGSIQGDLQRESVR